MMLLQKYHRIYKRREGVSKEIVNKGNSNITILTANGGRVSLGR